MSRLSTALQASASAVGMGSEAAIRVVNASLFAYFEADLTVHFRMRRRQPVLRLGFRTRPSGCAQGYELLAVVGFGPFEGVAVETTVPLQVDFARHTWLFAMQSGSRVCQPQPVPRSLALVLNDEFLLLGVFVDDLPLGTTFDDRLDREVRFITNDLGVNCVGLFRPAFEQFVPGQALSGRRCKRKGVLALANTGEKRGFPNVLEINRRKCRAWVGTKVARSDRKSVV